MNDASTAGDAYARQALPEFDNEQMQLQMQAARAAWTVTLHAGQRSNDPQTQPAQWEHARHMFQRLRAGHLMQVCVFPNSGSLLGVAFAPPGMDEMALRGIFDSDPAVVSGRATYELHTSLLFRDGT